MSDDSFTPDRALPCGRTLSELLDVLSGSAPAEVARHSADCPHCQRELAELRRSWEPVRRAAEFAVEPPDGLVERTLSTVRGLRETVGAVPVEIHQDGGTLRVSPRAVVVLTRVLGGELLGSYPGVHLRGCTGDAEEVRVDLAVRYPLPAADLSARVQEELVRGLQDVLGLAAPSVGVLIADVLPREAR